MAAGDERRRSALILSRIGRIRRRLNSELWIRQGVVPLWSAAGVVALHRLLLRNHTPIVAGLVFAAALVWWWYRARRHQVSTDEAAVLLDRSADAGGLVLTRMELPLGAWEFELNDRVRKAPMPEVSRAKSVGFSLLAFAFLAAALLVPLPKQLERQVNAAAATKVAQVEARAEALAKEVPLEQGVEAELARLREELSDGRFDAADWEAADHLDSQLAQKAADAAADLSRAADAAQALEDAMAKSQGQERASRERDELERSLMNLDPGAQSGSQALDNALAQLGSGDSQNGSQNGNDGQSGDGQQGENGQSGQSGASGQQGSSGSQGQNGSQSGQQGQNGSSGQQGASGSQGQNGSQSGQQGQSGSSGKQNGQGKSGQSGQSGSKSGGPSKSQISDLKKALQNRQDQLAKAYGQNGTGSKTAQNGSGLGNGGASSRTGHAGNDGNGNGNGSGNGNGNGHGHGSGNGDGNGRGMNTEPCEVGGCRGGGEGNLTFDNPNEVNPDRLAFSPLPEGHGGDEPGQLWGLRAVDPKPSTEPSFGAGSGAASAQGDQAPGNDQGTLLPRNRDLIKRYFDTQKSSSNASP